MRQILTIHIQIPEIILKVLMKQISKIMGSLPMRQILTIHIQIPEIIPKV